MKPSLPSSETYVLIFDWGDTVMRDYGYPGKMSDWEQVDWIPGMEESLNQLFPDYFCCIATSASHSTTPDMILALSRVGADRYFHRFFSSTDLGFAKPDPMFFQSICNQLKVRANRCIMIGNLYDKDIVGAKKAGMKTILFNEKDEPGIYELADIVLTSMEMLPNAVEKLKFQLND